MEGDAPRQSHTTFGIVERSSDGGFILKAFKQKLFVDGFLQEVIARLGHHALGESLREKVHAKCGANHHWHE